jgi:glutathione S-transferase
MSASNYWNAARKVNQHISAGNRANSMKLFYSTASPYVRKVLVTGIEAGLDEEIERIKPEESVWVGDGDPEVSAENPLGKIPTLITRDGSTLIDSTLICEYLSSLSPKAKLLPTAGPERWRVLNLQALAQGVMDAIIFRSFDTLLRPEQFRWEEWAQRQTNKISRTIDSFEAMSATGKLESDGAVNLGTISLGCVLGYLDKRFDDSTWCENRPNLSVWYDNFSQRESMLATIPPPLPPAHLDPRRG